MYSQLLTPKVVRLMWRSGQALTRTLRVTLSPAQPDEESRTNKRILTGLFLVAGLPLTLLKYAGGSETRPYETSVTLSACPTNVRREVEGCNSFPKLN